MSSSTAVTRTRHSSCWSAAGHCSGRLGRGYTVLAEIWADLGEPNRALEVYELAIELLEATPNRYLVDAYRRQAELLEAQGRRDEALEALKRAVHVQSV